MIKRGVQVRPSSCDRRFLKEKEEAQPRVFENLRSSKVKEIQVSDGCDISAIEVFTNSL